MNIRKVLLALTMLVAFTILALAAHTGYTSIAEQSTGQKMTSAAQAFVTTLSGEEQKKTVLEFDTPKRIDWHFIPKDYRKGLQLAEMNEAQRKAAHTLLKMALSDAGYDKATQIMGLERVLAKLEGSKGRWKRDSLRYYFTLFGSPEADAKWGLSIEGHHLSLNFVIDSGKLVASTPQFVAANPALVKGNVIPEVKRGTRVLAAEELVAFDLVNSLTDDQRKDAIIAEKAPKEIRDAGSPQPPTAAAVGIQRSELTEDQRTLLRRLVWSYLQNMPQEVIRERVGKIRDGGFDNIRFAWAGPTKPGIGHYYRIQGANFLIEFVNTQPDAAGNPANHIHCVWRDLEGDFGIPVK